MRPLFFISLSLVSGCATAIAEPYTAPRTDAAVEVAEQETAPVLDTRVPDEDTAVVDTGTEPVDAGPCGLTVNELQTGDATIGGSADFVELYNSCASSTSLSGYKLVYRSSAGTTDVIVWTFPSSATIAGRGYVVIGGSGYTGSSEGTLSSGLAVGGGGIGIRDGSDALIDSVGYGSATNALVEGSVAPAPGDSTPAKSIARKPNGRDSDDNATDFTVADPTPGAPN